MAAAFEDAVSPTVTLPGGGLMSVHAVNARRDGDSQPDWYDQVWLGFDPASAILLRD